MNVYVEGRPSNVVEFINGEFRRRVSRPALEAAIVYDPATGHTSTVAKGGKEVHEALRRTFAQKLLKIEPKFDAVERRPFVLDSLKAPSPLAADPSLGIKAVRVHSICDVAAAAYARRVSSANIPACSAIALLKLACWAKQA